VDGEKLEVDINFSKGVEIANEDGNQYIIYVLKSMQI
jgi:hypothetical protein